jgi:hypothetical protein
MTRLSPSRYDHGVPALAAAGAYLLVVAGTYAFMLVGIGFVEHPDATMSGVLPYFATMPLSLLGILAVPDSDGPLGTAVLLAVPALAGLTQAGGLWLLLRGRRRSPARH